MKRIPFIVLLVIFLTACQAPAWGNSVPATIDPGTLQTIPSSTPTLDLQVIGSPVPPSADSPTSVGSPTPTLAPDAWKSLPIVPTVSPEMIQVYQRGLAAGRDPSKFSKIGDCQNITTYYLADFDNPANYRLGPEYAYLQPTIDHFKGSWSRESISVAGGMGVAAVQSPTWLVVPMPAECRKGESPMACEIRVNNPSIAIISMETWYGNKPASGYEKYLRKVVEYVLSQNVVPILATKADNLEGDYSINAAIARVAYDYKVPLWNFWAATYPLPAHGLVPYLGASSTPDNFHLTQGRSFFDDPARMEEAWPWRNLTALEAIDAVHKALNGLH
jgi:hypothetical protein